MINFLITKLSNSLKSKSCHPHYTIKPRSVKAHQEWIIQWPKKNKENLENFHSPRIDHPNSKYPKKKLGFSTKITHDKNIKRIYLNVVVLYYYQPFFFFFPLSYIYLISKNNYTNIVKNKCQQKFWGLKGTKVWGFRVIDGLREKWVWKVKRV